MREAGVGGAGRTGDGNPDVHGHLGAVRASSAGDPIRLRGDTAGSSRPPTPTGDGSVAVTGRTGRSR